MKFSLLVGTDNCPRAGRSRGSHNNRAFSVAYNGVTVFNVTVITVTLVTAIADD